MPALDDAGDLLFGEGCLPRQRPLLLQLGPGNIGKHAGGAKVAGGQGRVGDGIETAQQADDLPLPREDGNAQERPDRYGMGDLQVARQRMARSIRQQGRDAAFEGIPAVDLIGGANVARLQQGLIARRIDIQDMAFVALQPGDVSDAHSQMAARGLQSRLDDRIGIGTWRLGVRC